MMSFKSTLSLSIVACIFNAVNATASPTTTIPNIKLDQFGYLPNTKKIAIVANPKKGNNVSEAFIPGTGANQYQVRRWSDDVVVFSGTLSPWNNGATHLQSGDQGWWFDFSSVTTPGSYYIYDTLKGVGSYRFEIDQGVYAEVLKQAGRMFYYQRLNTPKTAPYADPKWADAAAYQGVNQDFYARDSLQKTNAATARDLSGGWMDAGDTNKYTTFAEDAVLQLLEAYRMNPSVFTDNWNIPESGNGVPDILDEVKWELEFLKRMQNATGTKGLLLKIGMDTYDGDVTPLSRDTRPRYYVGECTSSTLSGAAMFALASNVLKTIPSQTTYAADLLTRAEAAWSRASATTSNFTRYQENCDNTDIKAGDADHDAETQLGSAMNAAIYLYEATGKTTYRNFVENRYQTAPPMKNGWWGPYTLNNEIALLRYSNMNGVSASIASAIRTSKLNSPVFSLVDASAKTDLYRAYISDNEFGWGHNSIRSNAASSNLNNITFGLNKTQSAQYADLAGEHMHWLHGANPLGLVMLSNMQAYGAEKSVTQLTHAWFADGSNWDSASTSLHGPAPGYVPGGPNKNYSGSRQDIRNQPYQKAYIDWNTSSEKSWEITEPAIYYQSAYIMMLSRVMGANAASSTTGSEIMAYDDALKAGWSDWGWNQSTTNVSYPVKVGAVSAKVDYLAWGGVSLRRDTNISLSSTNSGVRFWAYSPVATSIIVYIQSTDSGTASTEVVVNLPANTWQDVFVSRAQLGNPGIIRRLSIQLNQATPATVYYDQIRVQN